MSANESMGERLKKLRLEAKLTQQDVANLVGKSKGNVSGYENGNFEPSANTIIQLAKCFKVSTDFILTGTKNENHANCLTEGERDILELVHPLSPKEQQRVVGVIESYLGKRTPPQEPESLKPSAEFDESNLKQFDRAFEAIAKMVK